MPNLNKFKKTITASAALMAITGSLISTGCASVQSRISLPASELQSDIRQVNQYDSTSAGHSLYASSNINAIEATRQKLLNLYPASTSPKMIIGFSISENLVDGEFSHASKFTRTGSMSVANKLVKMTEGTSIKIVLNSGNFCDPNFHPNVKRFMLSTQLTDFDPYIYNRTVGPATTLESGGYSGDISRGSEVSRDSFYLTGTLMGCDGSLETVENQKFEVQSTREDKSIVVFAKVLGVILRNTQSNSPGLNNAVYLANDAMLSSLMLNHVRKQHG